MGFLENVSGWLRGTPNPSNFTGITIDVEDAKDTTLDDGYINSQQVDAFGTGSLRKAKIPTWYSNHPYGKPRPHNDYIYRKLAQMGMVQRCISIVLDEVLDSPWDIIPEDPKDDSEETLEEARKAKKKLLNINSNEASYFQEWRKALTDFYEVGDGVLVKSFDRKQYTNVNGHYIMLPESPVGDVNAFQIKAYDSTEFLIFETSPGDILGHFQFNFRGSVPQFFTPRETIILMDGATTYRSYGRSRIIQIKDFLEMTGAQMLQMKNYYQKGGIFQGIIKTTGFGKEEKEKVTAFFQSKFKTMQHKIGLLQSTNEGATVDFIPLMLSVEDLAFLDGFDFVQRFIASVYGVTFDELGLGTEGGSKGARAEGGRIFRRRTVRTMKHMIEYRTNNEVLPEISNGKIKFAYDETPEPEIRRIEQELSGSQIDRDQITLNEWRTKNGYQAYEGYGDEPRGKIDQEAKKENALLMADQLGGSPVPKGMEGRDGSEDDPAVSSEEDTEGGDPEKKTEDLDRAKKALYLESHDIQLIGLEVYKILAPLLNKKEIVAGDPSTEVFTPEEKPELDQECIIKNFTRVKSNHLHMEETEVLAKAVELCALAKHPSKKEGSSKALELMSMVNSKAIEDELRDERLKETFEPLEDELRASATSVFNKWKDNILDLEFDAMSIDELRVQIDMIVSKTTLAQAIADILFESFNAGLRMTDDIEISDLPTFTLVDSQAIEYFKTKPLLVSESISERLHARLKNELIDGVARGLSIPSLRENVRSIFKNFTTYEADRLARTEITNASTWGRINQMRGEGRTKWKFYTSLDERVCPECAPLHGKVFDIDDLEFKPPVHPNCRCTVLTTVGDSDTKNPWFPSAKIGEIEFSRDRPIEAIINELYNLDKLGFRGISKELGVSHTTVANWVKMMGIKKIEVEA